MCVCVYMQTQTFPGNTCHLCLKQVSSDLATCCARCRPEIGCNNCPEEQEKGSGEVGREIKGAHEREEEREREKGEAGKGRGRKRRRGRERSRNNNKNKKETSNSLVMIILFKQSDI